MSKSRMCRRCGHQIGSYDHVMAHRGKPVMASKSRHTIGLSGGHGIHAPNADDTANRAHKAKLW